MTPENGPPGTFTGHRGGVVAEVCHHRRPRAERTGFWNRIRITANWWCGLVDLKPMAFGPRSHGKMETTPIPLRVSRFCTMGNHPESTHRGVSVVPRRSISRTLGTWDPSLTHAKRKAQSRAALCSAASLWLIGKRPGSWRHSRHHPPQFAPQNPPRSHVRDLP